MGLTIVFGIVIFGFVILVLTGLGILTQAIFAISPGTVSGQDPVAIANIKKTPLKDGVTQQTIDTIVASYPLSSNSIETGQYIIDLKGSNLIVSKISLITFWILIIIGVLGAKFFM